MDSIGSFFETVSQDADICDEIGALPNEEALLAYINAHGCKATKNELDRFIDFMVQGGEITDDMAAVVAGGRGCVPSMDVHRLLAHFITMRS